MTTKFTAETFLGDVRKSGLIAPDQLRRLLQEFRERRLAVSDAQVLATELVAAGALTRWQADMLLKGRHSGFILGKYRLLSVLGKGGMSTVYLAEHVLMRRRCAIKVLPKHLVKDRSYLGRFHREAQAVASLDHSNIVRAYDVDQEIQKNAPIHFLVMEYVEGQSLLELVQRRGPFDFVSAADCIRQTAEGLAHAHASGMVHRDVKPGNLLVDSTGVVKILDLGLARFFHDKEEKSLTLAHDEKVLGTADYLAPEQAVDSHAADARADIYSLGCTFYFLLAGHPPFPQGTLAERLLAHQYRDPRPITDGRADTPPALVAVLERMMAKDPDDRFQSARDVADALVDWLHENGGDEWRRKNPGLSGSGSGGSDLRGTGTAAESAARATTSGTAMHADTVAARSASTTKGRPAPRPARRKIALPQATEPAGASASDGALATFLTNLGAPAAPPAAAEAEARRTEPTSRTSPELAPRPAAQPSAAPSADDRATPSSPAPAAASRTADRPAAAGETVTPAAAAGVPVARAVRPAGQEPAKRAASAAGESSGGEETLVETPGSRTSAQAAAVPVARPAGPAPVRPSNAVVTAAPPPAGTATKPGPTPPRMPARPVILGSLGLVLLAIGGLIFALTRTGSETEPGAQSESSRPRPRPVPPAAPPRDPRKLIGRDIHVGPAGAFKTINEAVSYVREHFEPRSTRDKQTIRVAGGLSYSERLDLSQASSGHRPFPQGVIILCSDQQRAVLEPVGGEAVIKLDGVQHFALEGFEIRGSRPTAVELKGYLEGTRLTNVTISGFAQTGLLGSNAKGTLSVGSNRNELLLDRIEFRGGGPNSVALRLEGETGRVQVLRCRFLQPLTAGIEIRKEAVYLDVRHSIFANVDAGIRLLGAPFLKNLTLAHNTFHNVNRGIVLAEMPQPSSGDLAFHRNLFDEIAAAEVVVVSKFDQRQFERMLAAGGPEQNWTTRKGPLPEGALDLFTTGGRPAATVAYASTDPAAPKFLAPAPESPHAQVPALPGSGLEPYIGAVPP